MNQDVKVLEPEEAPALQTAPLLYPKFRKKIEKMWGKSFRNMKQPEKALLRLLYFEQDCGGKQEASDYWKAKILQHVKTYHHLKSRVSHLTRKKDESDKH